jgi:hypothetical protein
VAIEKHVATIAICFRYDNGSMMPICPIEETILAYFLDAVILVVMGRSGSKRSRAMSITVGSNEMRMSEIISRLRNAEPLGDRLW